MTRLRHALNLLALVALVLLGVAGSAVAHPSAISTFDARTDGDTVRFAFQLDATSVVDLVARVHPERPPMAKPDVETERATVLQYMDDRFSVATSGQGCTREEPSRLEYEERIDRVHLEFVVRCGTALETLVIRSSLFQDEDTPHQVLGSLRHQRAFERYFFTRGEQVATIPLGSLRQRPDVSTVGKRQFRMATPPPGAFSGTPEEPAPEPMAGATAAPSDASPAGPESAADPIGTGFLTFLRQGVIHIFGGLDHVLFVICLVVAVSTWKQLAIIVTTFTVAHSITLVLGALDLVIVAPILVEPVIALSIIYVAVENMVRKQPKARVGVVFGFGLVHGLGFSSVLRDLGLPAGDLLHALLGFNVGVEVGQLFIVLPLFPLVMWLRRQEPGYARMRLYSGGAVAAVACWWFVERVTGA